MTVRGKASFVAVKGHSPAMWRPRCVWVRRGAGRAADDDVEVTIWLPVTPGATPAALSHGVGAVVKRVELLRALGIREV
jgi:hypothetical protein